MSLLRKDYGSAAIVSDTNAVIKTVNVINSPFSAQALGLSLTTERFKGAQVPLDLLEVVGDRIFVGNANGLVKSITLDTGAFVSLVVAFDREGEEDALDVTFSALELTNNTSMIID